MKNKLIHVICILLTLSIVFSLSVLFIGCNKELTEAEKLWENRYQPIYGPQGSLANFLVVKKSCVAKNGNVSESKTFYNIDGVLEDRGIRYDDSISYGHWDNLYGAGGDDILNIRNLYGTRAKIVEDKLQMIDSTVDFEFDILGYEVVTNMSKKDIVLRVVLTNEAYRTLFQDVYLISTYYSYEHDLTGEIIEGYNRPILVFHFKKELSLHWTEENPVFPDRNDYNLEFFFIMYANQLPEKVKPISFVPSGNY